MTKHLCLPILVFCMLLPVVYAGENAPADATTDNDIAASASGQTLSSIFTAYLPYAFNHQFSDFKTSVAGEMKNDPELSKDKVAIEEAKKAAILTECAFTKANPVSYFTNPKAEEAYGADGVAAGLAIHYTATDDFVNAHKYLDKAKGHVLCPGIGKILKFCETEKAARDRITEKIRKWLPSVRGKLPEPDELCRIMTDSPAPLGAKDKLDELFKLREEATGSEVYQQYESALILYKELLDESVKLENITGKLADTKIIAVDTGQCTASMDKDTDFTMTPEAGYFRPASVIYSLSSGEPLLVRGKVEEIEKIKPLSKRSFSVKVPRFARSNPESMLELTDAAESRVSGYSSGMRQRLSIARGLFSKPELLLLDEPTRMLMLVKPFHV